MSKAVKKTECEICPFCGSEFTECEERTIDLGLNADGEFQTYLFERRTCTDCHEEFTDYYLVEYDGYFTNKHSYDRNGEEIAEE